MQIVGRLVDATFRGKNDFFEKRLTAMDIHLSLREDAPQVL